MEICKRNHEKLISDIVFLTQRASARTCEIVARTITSNAKKYLSDYPGMVRDISTFNQISGELCDCVLSLQDTGGDVGREIIIKRQALDLLLALDNELEFSFSGVDRKDAVVAEQEEFKAEQKFSCFV